MLLIVLSHVSMNIPGAHDLSALETQPDLAADAAGFAGIGHFDI